MRVLLFIFSLITLNVSAQQKQKLPVDELRFYSDVMVSAIEAEHRSYAAGKFYKAFKTYIDSVNVFSKDLSQFKSLSVVQPVDEKFKLISWQIERSEFDYFYHAFIVNPDGSYLELQDRRDFDSSTNLLALPPDDWYGALYYNIFKQDEYSYLLFGYNAHSEFDHIKIADILCFDKDKVTIGKPAFQNPDGSEQLLMRIILEYSSDASVNLNYNPGLKMIVMDHLTPRMGKQAGQGPTMIPDGTYKGFELRDGNWIYVDKLYNHSYGEGNAPRPKPVLDEDKNLFGKQKPR